MVWLAELRGVFSELLLAIEERFLLGQTDIEGLRQPR